MFLAAWKGPARCKVFLDQLSVLKENQSIDPVSDLARQSEEAAGLIVLRRLLGLGKACRFPQRSVSEGHDSRWKGRCLRCCFLVGVAFGFSTEAGQTVKQVAYPLDIDKIHAIDFDICTPTRCR